MGGTRSSKAVLTTGPTTSVLNDIQNGDSALTLSQASHLPLIKKNGRAPAASTLWRWSTSGVKVAGGRRVKLEVARNGGALVTSQAAVDRFVARLTDPALPADAPTPGESARAHRRAGAELDAAGVF